MPGPAEIVTARTLPWLPWGQTRALEGAGDAGMGDAGAGDAGLLELGGWEDAGEGQPLPAQPRTDNGARLRHRINCLAFGQDYFCSEHDCYHLIENNYPMQIGFKLAAELGRWRISKLS